MDQSPGSIIRGTWSGLGAGRWGFVLAPQRCAVLLHACARGRPCGHVPPEWDDHLAGAGFALERARTGTVATERLVYTCATHVRAGQARLALPYACHGTSTYKCVNEQTGDKAGQYSPPPPPPAPPPTPTTYTYSAWSVRSCLLRLQTCSEFAPRRLLAPDPV